MTAGIATGMWSMRRVLCQPGRLLPGQGRRHAEAALIVASCVYRCAEGNVNVPLLRLDNCLEVADVVPGTVAQAWIPQRVCRRQEVA
jgi:hypothetical protein